MKPIIAITMGDAAGIGPEILLKSLPQPVFQRLANYVVFGDYSYLYRYHQFQKKKGRRDPFHFCKASPSTISGIRYSRFGSAPIPILDYEILENHPLSFGRPMKICGTASGVFIKEAVSACLKRFVDAMVTLPINKKSFSLSSWGKKYRGHTEMLTSLTGVSASALMLANGPLRAVHVSQHIPLRDVPRHITRKRVMQTIRLAHEGLKKIGFRNPRIAVCGLNPHAGDQGVLGEEEKVVIEPVIKLCRKRGWSVFGPFSADVVWPQVRAGTFDVGVAMYHDQGQIPVKLCGESVVNVTLGLPIVRTSVGHGTAFDIAGKGTASNKSFLEALQYAVKLISGNISEKR